jgi:hypothetical protein
MAGPRLKRGAVVMFENFAFDSYADLKFSSCAGCQVVVDYTGPRRDELKTWARARIGERSRPAVSAFASTSGIASGGSAAGPCDKGTD